MKHLNNGANLSTLKSNNRSLILKVLNTLGEVPRAELARITGLTKTSITNITAELIAEGIITETGTLNSSAGRKPTLLKISGDSLYALGLYISRDYIYCNIVNLRGEILGERKHPLDVTESETSFFAAIFSCLEDLLSEHAERKEKILGLGIASIGPLDYKNGIILDPPNFRGLQSIPIVERLSERFHFKTFLENDMKASAIAEMLFGNAKNRTDFIYVGVTNGIGSGIVLGSNIFRGSNGFAGEIGHMTVDIQGERCACGNLGCLELYASIPAIVEQVRSSIRLGGEGIAALPKNLTWPELVLFAAQGEALCQKAIDRLNYFLSAGLITLLNTFDPEIVFLGHDIALAGELVTQPLSEMINNSVLFRKSKKVRVELSKFKDYAPCIGAAAIVIHQYFTHGENI